MAHTTSKAMEFTKCLFLFMIIGLSVFTRGVMCYSSGAPAIRCDTMVPGHRGSGASLSVSPYRISLSKDRYGPFEAVEVTIDAFDEYAGFMIQARNANNTNEYVGSFEPGGVDTKYVCGQQGLTHTTSSLKRSRTFIWRAPISGSADVVFRATVVKNYLEYYVDMRSNVLRPMAQATTTTTETTTTSTEEETTTTTADPPTTTTTSTTTTTTTTTTEKLTNTPPPTTMAETATTAGGTKIVATQTPTAPTTAIPPARTTRSQTSASSSAPDVTTSQNLATSPTQSERDDGENSNTDLNTNTQSDGDDTNSNNFNSGQSNSITTIMPMLVLVTLSLLVINAKCKI